MSDTSHVDKKQPFEYNVLEHIRILLLLISSIAAKD